MLVQSAFEILALHIYQASPLINLVVLSSLHEVVLQSSPSLQSELWVYLRFNTNVAYMSNIITNIKAST
jgi:hypothetical protein